MTTHRSFALEFKAQVVLEVLTGVRSESRSLSALSTEAGSHLSTEGAATIFAGEIQSDPALARVAELERLVGRLTLELEVAK